MFNRFHGDIYVYLELYSVKNRWIAVLFTTFQGRIKGGGGGGGARGLLHLKNEYKNGRGC